jgi:hypothetical protein
MTCALALADLELHPNERRKINHYLDATRAAILFARRIILVEGTAEALLPVLARKLVFRDDLAKQREFHAVTIVNVGESPRPRYWNLRPRDLSRPSPICTYPCALSRSQGAAERADAVVMRQRNAPVSR